MTLSTLDARRAAKNLEASDPREIIAFALANYPNLAISFSGAEDVVLIDIAVRINPRVSVFCLDTGRLHTETYRFIEKVREHYHLKLEILTPDANALEALVREKGLFSFYRDGHEECGLHAFEQVKG